MNLNRYVLYILTILILSLVIGCGHTIKTDVTDGVIEDIDTLNQEPVVGGEVILPLTNFSTLNPLLTDNFYYHQFSKLIFEGLFELDDDLNVIPKLADSYNIYDEGKSISVRLKDNINWHDGKRVTSEDVKFTISAIKHAGNNGTYGKAFESIIGREININNFIDIRIIDDKNMEFRFEDRFSNNLECLIFPIIPKHIFNGTNENISYQRALNKKDYTPIGTGPYKFVSYEKFKSIRLRRNTEYWSDIPYIESVTGRVLEDEDLVLTAFETGQISFAPTIGVDWDKYKQNSRIKVLEYISPSYEFLGFNYGNNILGGEKGQAIKKAINYGIDRQQIIQKVVLGHGTQIDIPIYPNSYLVSNAGNVYGYNPDKARQILNEVGYKDLDGDGILEDEEGNRLSLRLVTNSYNIYRLRMAEIIAEQLSSLGIDIQLDIDKAFKENIDEDMKSNQWNLFSEKIKSGNYDIVLLGWETSIVPNIFSMFHSSQIGKGNFIRIADEYLDTLIMDTLYASNREEKLKSYEELQKFVIDELPYISLYFKNRGLLVDTKIVGPLNPSFFNLYRGLDKSFIPEALQ